MPSRSRQAALFAISAVCLTLAGSAHAGLGEAYESVETDRVHLSAKIESATTATYAVHALTLANGGVAKEYTRADGLVFAVTWRAPGRPDLRQLLGGYFDTLQSDNALQAGRRTRRPLSVDRNDVVIHSGGHPGAFWGVALLPNAQPAGFSTSDLQ